MRSTIKIATLSAVALSTAAVLAGCSTSAGSPQQSGGAKKGLTFALVLGTTSDPFYITMAKGAREEAAKEGNTVKIYGDSTTYSPDVQVPIVNQVLTQSPDGLALVATDPNSLQPAVDRAVASKIPVVNVDNSVKDLSHVISFITGNNQDGGQKAADALAQAIGYKDGGTYQVVVAMTSATSGTNVERQNGFKSEIASKYPGIKIVATGYSQSNATKANTNVNNWITAYPDLEGIFAVDGNNAAGATSALQAKGLTGKVKLVGYDAIAANVKLLKQGVFTALIAQNPEEEGRQAIQDLNEYIQHGNSSKGIKKSVTLENITLTKDTSAADLAKYTYSSGN